MEANEYDSNHLDSDVLLPPRKRLLAGLKRQSSESPSQSSLENSSSLFPNEFDRRLQNLLKFYKNGPHMSSEEIAKAAGSAAVAATKAAKAARAAAEEKAAIAAKAVAAAKNALSLVASFSKETGRQSKKNKLKKHVPVELLYKEQQALESSGTDEDLARKLHRAINSSPRISKDSPKNKHKKSKPTFENENDGVPNDTAAGDGKSVSPYEADNVQEETNSESSYVAEAYDKASRSSKSDQVQVEEIPVEAETKERLVELPDGMHTSGRKRGRVKQKKLPLSLCSFKDRANPKEGLNQNTSDGGNKPVSPRETHADKRVSIEPSPTWKCQDFNVPQCIKSNKAVQS